MVNCPVLLELVQSDASGDVGFGYVYSSLGSDEYHWYSAQWPAGLSIAAIVAITGHFLISKTFMSTWTYVAFNLLHFGFRAN